MLNPARFLAAVALVAAVLTGCGSSEPSLPKDIPTANAQGLNGYLVQAQQACALGDKFGLRAAARAYSNAVADLPSSVDADVITVLRKGGDNLTNLAKSGDGCQVSTTGASGPLGVLP